MYVINGNIENPSIVILPNILVPKGVTEINGKLEFIDDETLDEIFTSEEGQYFIDESSEDLLFDVDDELLEEFF